MTDRDLKIDHGFDMNPTEPYEPNVLPAGGDAPEAQPRARLADTIPFPAAHQHAEADNDAAAPELKAIAEFLGTLARGVKSVRMYPANNPIYMRSVTGVVDKLNRAFQEFNLIRVVVGQTRLYFQGEIVYENADPEDSLSRLLFRDGIREISFHIGLDRDEMGRFLEMIRSALSREDSEDLVTQLWDDSLPHITYTAIDDMLDADLTESAIPAEFGSDFMNYIDFEMDFAEEEEAAEPTREAALAAAGEMHKKLMQAGETEIIGVTQVEKDSLAFEIQDEDAPAMTLRVLDTFFDVLDLEAETEAREVFLGVLDNALVSVMAQRQFSAGCHILESIEGMVARRPDLAQVHRKSIEAIHRTASDAARLEIITEILERNTGPLFEDVESYLKLLTPAAIPDLCDILGRVESRRARKVMCAVLLHLAHGRIDIFVPFLQDERWFLVRNVLTILGQTRNASAVKHIRPLVRHPEMRVRREALTALSLIGEREALDALVASLRDPDFRMRVSAARSLARLGRSAVNPLLQVVLGKDFEDRSIEEKRGFFEALGRTNAPEIMSYLKMLLAKRPLFKKTQAEEMRVCAVEALARMRLPEVRQLLAEAAKDPSSVVRAAVTGATRKHDDDGEDDV